MVREQVLQRKGWLVSQMTRVLDDDTWSEFAETYLFLGFLR